LFRWRDVQLCGLAGVENYALLQRVQWISCGVLRFLAPTVISFLALRGASRRPNRLMP
jgi:hypothetical protein